MNKITVLMATYNRSNLFKNALDSVINQRVNDFEILVVDDGSDEKELKKIKKYLSNCKKYRIIEQENRGPAAARALGVKKANTEYIYILDSDDIMLKGTLGKVLKTFEYNDNLDVIYGNIREFYNPKKKKLKKYRKFKNNRQMRKAIFLYPVVPFKHSAVAYRRKAALEIGNYNTEIQRKIDIDLMLSFLERGKKIHHINKPLVDFRKTPTNLSFNRIKGLKYWFKIIDKHERHLLLRIFYKVIRIFIETGKYAVESIKYTLK